MRWRSLAHVAMCALMAASVSRASDRLPEEEPRRVFVSIGSDDWGRWSHHGPLWPDLETRAWFGSEGLWLSGGDLSKTTVTPQPSLGPPVLRRQTGDENYQKQISTKRC